MFAPCLPPSPSGGAPNGDLKTDSSPLRQQNQPIATAPTQRNENKWNIVNCLLQTDRRTGRRSMAIQFRDTLEKWLVVLLALALKGFAKGFDFLNVIFALRKNLTSPKFPLSSLLSSPGWLPQIASISWLSGSWPCCFWHNKSHFIWAAATAAARF